MRKKAIALSLVVVSVLLANLSAFAQSGSITVDVNKLGPRIPSSLYGRKPLVPSKSARAPTAPLGYWSTDGFGYHEFLQFCEDIGGDALYVANVGISCAFRSGTFLPDEQLPTLIQDTLDAIEYALGPPDSKWGAVRAKNGHPKPFPLKYLEIGNEQQGPRYGERVARFTQAIKRNTRRLKWRSVPGLPALTSAPLPPPEIL